MSQQPMRPIIDPRTGLPIPGDPGIDPTMGMGTPPPAAQPGFMSKIQSALGGPQGMMNMGASLLAGSGPSPVRQNLGSMLGQSLLQNQQFQQQSGQDALQALLMKSQIERNTRESKPASPSSVQEYEYAKANGFKGSFQEWIVAGGQSSRPSSVQEWEHYNALSPEQKSAYLEMKRNPNVFFGKVNEVPTVVKAPTAGNAAVTTPLSTTASEAAAASQVKQAGNAGGALGTIQGEIQGSIEKKGSEAVSGGNILDIADPLIDVATGSGVGASRDKVAAFFGKSTGGSEAIGQLRVLQAALMMNQPRMEGPQGEKDVELYQQAAGQIGDPTVPGPIKKRAMQTIRQLQDRYKQRAGLPASGASGAPKRIRVDAQGNVIGN
jgi:hypothetical protein